MSLKKIIYGATFAYGVFASAAAMAAAPVIFDPDGLGPDGNLNITSFDWGPTTMTAQGGVSAIRNFQSSAGACPANSCDMNIYVQAGLKGTIGDSISGLNTTREYTMIWKFSERVSDVNIPGNGTATATFDVLTASPTYFEMYYDNNIADGTEANPLTGHGYTDGNLILTGNLIQNSQGVFQVQLGSSVPIESLSAAVPVDYTGQNSVISNFPPSGQQAMAIGGLVQDNAFFKNQLESFGFNFANISLEVPFVSVDPTDCVIDTAGTVVDARTVASNVQNPGYGCVDAHINGLYSDQTPATTAPDGFGFLPIVSTINGDVNDANALDFVAQTDFNSPVLAEDANVPLPGSLVFLGTGLSALGFLGRTRRRKVA